jgi:hypothetical protein
MDDGVGEIRENTDPGREAPEWWKRPSIVSVPVVFIGIVDFVKAIRRHDKVDAVWVAAIFFVACPILIFVRSHLRSRLRGRRWEILFWLLAFVVLGFLVWLFASHP